jgi:hypothetical protein
MEQSEKSTPSPYPLLVDALRLLPGVRPVRERDELGQAKHRASMTGMGDVHGAPVSNAQLEQLFIYDERGGGPRVSPAGAAFLLRLFHEGVLERLDARTVDGGVDLLAAYAEGRASVIGPGFWPKRKRAPSVKRVAATPPRETWHGTPALHPNRYAVTIHRLI